MREELPFSPLQPILFVVTVPTICYILLNKIGFVSSFPDWTYPFFIPLIGLFTWKYLRITVLTILQRPAVILTEESITITERNYTIYWKDIIDVYMGSKGPGRSIKTYGVIIIVRNPEKYIMKINNPITRYFRWYIRKWNESPFEIDLSMVKGDDDEIYNTILRYYQNNRGF